LETILATLEGRDSGWERKHLATKRL